MKVHLDNFLSIREINSFQWVVLRVRHQRDSKVIDGKHSNSKSEGLFQMNLHSRVCVEEDIEFVAIDLSA